MATTKAQESIREYLNSLGSTGKPQIDREAIKHLKAQIKDASDPIEKAKLYEALISEEQGHQPDTSGLRAVFLAEGLKWAESEGLSGEALARVGVPTDDLKEAGFNVSTKPKAAKVSRPRLSLDDVAKAAKKLPATWSTKNLQEALGTTPATAKKHVTALMEAGQVVEAGKDKSHSGKGRAAMLYSLK